MPAYEEEPTPPVELEELEPSPVDDYPPEQEPQREEYFPSSKAQQPPLQSSTSSLGLSGHGAPWYLLRAHKYSSYVFSAFLTAHITNTSLIPLYTRSVQGSSKYLLLTRPYYQSWPLAEPLIVIAPLVVHLVSGIALRIYRRQVLLKQLGAETRGERRNIAWPKLSGTSVLGYFAVPLVLGHTAINRMLPLWVDGGSSSIGLDFVSHGLNVGPTWYRIAGRVGYAALVAAVGCHVIWGWAQWLGFKPDQVQGRSTSVTAEAKAKRRWWTLQGISAAVVITWLAGGMGVIGRGGKVSGWVGRHYDELLRRLPYLASHV